MVLPGPGLDGDSLKNLINSENVTCAAGVPTLWQGLIGALKKANEKVPSLTRTVIGGSACPPSMIATFRDDYGVDTLHAWGMTEMSPVGSVSTLLHKHTQLSEEEQAAIRAKQGRPPFGVDLRIADADGNELPMDGETQGDLYAKGHWVISAYFNVDAEPPHVDGWFPTGDIATLDENGIVTIKDRSKDVIKSGGEWISSVELENIAVGMPELADAAVIAATHKKWDERPLLIAVKAEVTEERDRLTAHVSAARDRIGQGGPVGRKLDFLMQEFNREANTLCAKAQHTELTNVGLALKAVIDQMREQVQNVE